MSIYPSQVWFKFFRNPLDDSNTVKVDGSVTPVNFDITGDSGGDTVIYRVCAYMLDAGVVPSKFGGLAKLTNGVRVVILDEEDNEVLDFLDSYAIKDNADWALLTGVDNVLQAASGDDILHIRWTLTNGLGSPLVLPAGYRFRFIIRDDLTALTEFHILAQGRS